MTKDVKFSNIKGILIFLVVLGHLLLIVRGGMESLILLIYSFHMPAFIFLNGYFAKNVTWKKVLNLLLLYIIFQSFYAVITYVTHYGEIFTFRFTTPIFHLWYLVSLACFYAVAILLHKIGKYRIWSMLIIAGILVASVGIRWWATGFLIENPHNLRPIPIHPENIRIFPILLARFLHQQRDDGQMQRGARKRQIQSTTQRIPDFHCHLYAIKQPTTI
ncbi:acyltransferase family protein [Listeria newyorkensis]|uniref:Acyltransferase family protein n=1 Tax=Listeria newyorkensis TaxID=1497681 RepID=A0A841Z023_9LIST|nr:acyltransferase family protein [Listeria newyorkensis]